MSRRVLKFDGPLGRGLWIALSGNAYKVSVTGLTFQYHMTCLPQGKVVATATKEGKRRNGT